MFISTCQKQYLEDRLKKDCRDSRRFLHTRGGGMYDPHLRGEAADAVGMGARKNLSRGLSLSLSSLPERLPREASESNKTKRALAS